MASCADARWPRERHRAYNQHQEPQLPSEWLSEVLRVRTLITRPQIGACLSAFLLLLSVPCDDFVVHITSPDLQPDHVASTENPSAACVRTSCVSTTCFDE